MPAPALPDALRADGRPVRAVRSFATALVCTMAATVAHMSSGGVVPGAAVAAVFVGAAAVAWLVSARRVTTGQLVGLLVLCQVCVHLACSTDEMTMSATMLAMHAAATAVSAAAMARGESFAWSIAERLALRVMPVGGRNVLVPAVRAPLPVGTIGSLHITWLAHSQDERGPPVGL